jgi:RND superfamily putative drug exporter
VRMLLMPALMHLLGRSAWWLPRWLDRILPDVDIEGAALERTHPGTHPGAHAAAPTAATLRAESAAAPRD